MTAPASAPTTGPSYRAAAWAAIASGAIGVLAYASMTAAVFVRSAEIPSELLFRVNDAGVILQCLLMISAAIALYRLSRQRPPAMNRATLAFGIMALALTVVWLALIFVHLAWDAVYMIPQGLIGAWAMLVSWRLSGVLSRGVRWLGMIAGFGMLLAGQFPISYVIFVEPVNYFTPVPDDSPMVETTANNIIHRFLIIGSWFGVLPYTFWSMFVGRRLLRGIDERLRAVREA